MIISILKLAQIVGCEATGVFDHDNIEKTVTGIAPFDIADESMVTLAENRKYLKRIDQSCAGAFIVPKNFCHDTKTLIKADNPRVVFAKILGLFNPPLKLKAGIAANVVLGENVNYGKNVSISSGVVIADNVSLGDNVTLHPNVVIENDVTIGNDVEIFPNVTIYEKCCIGNRVIVHAGTVIGSHGYGFAPDGPGYFKIPQVGMVQIDDDVELGASNTIDRGTIGKTWIQKGVKTDNLVHIGHNVTVGENTVLVAQVGIAGSVTIGKHAILAGQVGVSGHLTIGDNVIIGPQAGIAKSIPDGQTVSGSPEMPHRTWLRVHNIIPKLPDIVKKISEIEKRLTSMGK